MKKINNKGFTLVEVLAVVAIIAILGIIAVPNVLNIINTSNESSYDILVKNITTASKQLYEEIDYIGNEIFHYNENGGLTTKITKNKDDQARTKEEITVNLQTLVSNGFLTGNNNPDKNGNNKNNKIITNPKTKEDIGACEIIITKTVDNNQNTSYKIKNNSTSNINCPTDIEYAEVSN